MGVFDNLKQRFNAMFNRNKVKALPQQSIYEQNYLNQMISFSTNTPGEHVMLHEIKYSNQINHSNGRNTNLMMAKVSVGRDGEKENLSGDYIAFEIEPGERIDQTLLNKIVYNYLIARGQNANDKRRGYYIGELNNDINDNTTRKSDSVQAYVDTQIFPSLGVEKVSEKEQFEAYLRQGVNPTIEQRRDNPFVNNNMFIKQRMLHDEEYEKKFHDYDASKIDTGTVLRLRKLNKVAKDQNGRYIYTAFLKEAYSEDEGEKIYSQNETPLGVPICFTLDERFEDIVKSQNPEKMKPLLQMLSARETLERRTDVLNYVGNVDRAGNISRDIFSNSSAIVNKINELQHGFGLERQDDQQMRI